MCDNFYKKFFCCSNSKNLNHFITFYSIFQDWISQSTWHTFSKMPALYNVCACFLVPGRVTQ